MQLIFKITIAFLFLSTVALGETVKGRVRNSGVGIVQSVHLIDEETASDRSLCAGDVSGKVKKLSGMVIEVEGLVKKRPNGNSECFDAIGFRIIRNISGRAPLIGLLKVENDVVSVVSEDGVAHILNEVSSGLKKLVGKKVILDVRSNESGDSKGLKVISYSSFPD
jgi:hypothetical protein